MMMNDRFKFRVWDNVNNRYVNKGVLLRCGELAIPTMKNDYDMNPVDGRYFIEQSTGLKDKNGKLIYEGDIVKGSNGSINGQEWEFTHVVKWNDKLHRIVLPDFESDEDWSHYYNVIGNIHENSELLKEA